MGIAGVVMPMVLNMFSFDTFIESTGNLNGYS
jgi:hypothetical protein